MKSKLELIKAETRRLEALGVVLGMLGLAKPAGRSKVHATKAARQRAYRERMSEKPLSEIRQKRKATALEESPGHANAQKLSRLKMLNSL
jgi:hypothetical protein